MQNLDDSDLKRLLTDTRLPTVDRTYRNPGFRHFLVWRTLALAEAEFGRRTDLDKTVETLVERVGGERIDTVDPWRWLPDLARRMLGQPLPPREDVYAIPEQFVDSAVSSVGRSKQADEFA